MDFLVGLCGAAVGVAEIKNRLGSFMATALIFVFSLSVVFVVTLLL